MVPAEANGYAQVIDIYARDKALQLGKKLHARLIVNGFARLTLIASRLIALYVECGTLSHARDLFEKIPATNVGGWIALIGASARCGFHKEALSLFSGMRAQGLKPNVFVMPSVLKACAHLGLLMTGEQIHGMLFKCSFQLDAFVSSALVDMYSKCARVEVARKVFDGMLEKDLVALNAIVSGYAQHGLSKDALVLVERMRMMGLRPNVITWNTLIAGFSKEGDEATVCELFSVGEVIQSVLEGIMAETSTN